MTKAVTVAITLSIALAAHGCKDEDTGTCCISLSKDAASAIPVPDTPDGGIPRDLVAVHPAFDCEQLTCVSWQGSEAFCSRKCDDKRKCPDGFLCRPVLESSPGAGAGIQPDDTFCVRAACDDMTPCPEGFDCKLVHQGSDPISDPDIRHCYKAEHACPSK